MYIAVDFFALEFQMNSEFRYICYSILNFRMNSRSRDILTRKASCKMLILLTEENSISLTDPALSLSVITLDILSLLQYSVDL